MITLPPPIRRIYRKRSPAQRAAIARSQELRAVRRAGGGRAAVTAVLAPAAESGDLEFERRAEPVQNADLKACGLCCKSIGKSRTAWYSYRLAHDKCVRAWLLKLGFTPAIIACEMAIRSRLAAELRGKQSC